MDLSELSISYFPWIHQKTCGLINSLKFFRYKKRNLDTIPINIFCGLSLLGGDIIGMESVTLRKKCPYLEFFWSVFSRIWTKFSPNAGKYGPKKLRIRTLFTQYKVVKIYEMRERFLVFWNEPFLASWLFSSQCSLLIPLTTSENLRFSGVFRRIKREHWEEKG